MTFISHKCHVSFYTSAAYDFFTESSQTHVNSKPTLVMRVLVLAMLMKTIYPKDDASAR